MRLIALLPLLAVAVHATLIGSDNFDDIPDGPLSSDGSWSGPAVGAAPQVQSGAVVPGSIATIASERPFFAVAVLTPFFFCFTLEISAISASTEFIGTFNYLRIAGVDGGGSYSLTELESGETGAATLNYNTVYTVVARMTPDLGTTPDSRGQTIWIDPTDPTENVDTPYIDGTSGGALEERCCRITSSDATYIIDNLVVSDSWSDLIGPAVHGDPHFVGFHGQRYDVDGKAGEVYNLISDKNIQFNSRFVKCPEDHAEAGPQCVVNGEFGIQTPTSRWLITRDGLVEHNGAVVETDASVISVETDDYVFEIQCVRGQELNIVGIEEKQDDEVMAPHGLLGFTHLEQERDEEGFSEYLEGALEDYREQTGDIFGRKFTFNLFE